MYQVYVVPNRSRCTCRVSPVPLFDSTEIAIPLAFFSQKCPFANHFTFLYGNLVFLAGARQPAFSNVVVTKL